MGWDDVGWLAEVSEDLKVFAGVFFGFWHITKHVAFPTKQNSFHIKSRQENCNQKIKAEKSNFHFEKKKHLPTLSSGSSFQFQKKEPCEAFLANTASGIGRTWGRTATSKTMYV